MSIGKENANQVLVIVKYLSPATSTAIIRCPRASYRLVWTALTYLSRVPAISDAGRSKRLDPMDLTRPCVFRVIRVSGTIRKAEEEAVRIARREIVRLRGTEEVCVLGGLVGGLEKEIEKGFAEDSGIDDMEVDSGDD